LNKDILNSVKEFIIESKEIGKLTTFFLSFGGKYGVDELKLIVRDYGDCGVLLDGDKYTSVEEALGSIINLLDDLITIDQV